MITQADYDAMDEFFNGSGDGEAEEQEQPRIIKPNCQRKVIVGRKKKVCGDETNNSQCERCSNHCQDARCEAHGHYRRR
jgi:hypothetical protein